MDVARIPFVFGLVVSGRVSDGHDAVRLDIVGQAECLDSGLHPVFVRVTSRPHGAQADADFIKDATEQGMAINMLFGDDFNKFIENVEKTIKDLKIYE